MELQAVIDLEQFGSDADRLVEGSIISRPHRRDAHWRLMPIRQMDRAKWKRIHLRSQREAKRWYAILNDHQPD